VCVCVRASVCIYISLYLISFRQPPPPPSLCQMMVYKLPPQPLAFLIYIHTHGRENSTSHHNRYFSLLHIPFSHSILINLHLLLLCCEAVTQQQQQQHGQARPGQAASRGLTLDLFYSTFSYIVRRGLKIELILFTYFGY
jgi:hypothetical protein